MKLNKNKLKTLNIKCLILNFFSLILKILFNFISNNTYEKNFEIWFKVNKVLFCFNTYININKNWSYYKKIK